MLRRSKTNHDSFLCVSRPQCSRPSRPRLAARRKARALFSRIHPCRGEGTNHVANGLLLRADLHTLFDCNLLAVDPDGMRVVVAPSIRGSPYGKLHRRALRPRTDGRPEPSAEALRLRFEDFERTHGKTG